MPHISIAHLIPESVTFSLIFPRNYNINIRYPSYTFIYNHHKLVPRTTFLSCLHNPPVLCNKIPNHSTPVPCPRTANCFELAHSFKNHYLVSLQITIEAPRVRVYIRLQTSHNKGGYRKIICITNSWWGYISNSWSIRSSFSCTSDNIIYKYTSTGSGSLRSLQNSVQHSHTHMNKLNIFQSLPLF